MVDFFRRDNNGNLINGNSIMNMGQTYNVNDVGSWNTVNNELNSLNKLGNWMGITNTPEQQWQFNFNDQLSSSFNKHTDFAKLSDAQKLQFQNWFGENYSGDVTKNMSPAQLQEALSKWQSSDTSMGNNSMFGWGKDQYGNTTLGGATGFQWAGAGLGAMQALYGMYQGNKQMKMAKEAFDEQKRLSHANYQMQAKAYNNNLRNQQSGRSFSGMSGSAMRTLGSEYRTRRAKDDY